MTGAEIDNELYGNPSIQQAIDALIKNHPDMCLEARILLEAAKTAKAGQTMVVIPHDPNQTLKELVEEEYALYANGLLADAPHLPIRVENGYVILEEWMEEYGLVKNGCDEFKASFCPNHWMIARLLRNFLWHRNKYRRPIALWNSSEIGKKFPVEENV